MNKYGFKHIYLSSNHLQYDFTVNMNGRQQKDYFKFAGTLQQKTVANNVLRVHTNNNIFYTDSVQVNEMEYILQYQQT